MLKKFFRKYVLKNLSLKLTALAVAVLLWWTVGHDATVEIAMTVPIEFHSAPEDLQMISESPLQARVTMRGPERLLRGMEASQVHAIINLQGVNPGEHTFELTDGQIRVPRGVEVMQADPAQFHISFDHSGSRRVQVQPRVIGSLVSGYGITDIAAQPAQVTITGPQSRVNSIDRATTDPVDATGVVGQATFVTRAYVADPMVRVQTPASVQVIVTTGKSSATEKH
jgi:YbbR domain-containing protein